MKRDIVVIQLDFIFKIFKGEKEEISEGVGIFITCLDIAAWSACMA